jgi:hypothetical protein
LYLAFQRLSNSAETFLPQRRREHRGKQKAKDKKHRRRGTEKQSSAARSDSTQTSALIPLHLEREIKCLRRFVFWGGKLEAKKAPLVALATFESNPLWIRFVSLA